MQQPKYSFCTKQFRPVIAVVVLLAVVVVSWTAYQESNSKQGRGLGFMERRAIVPVATAPTIQEGEPQPHPDWGKCSMCHNVVPARRGGVGGRAAALMSVATAPPIQPGAGRPHPDWGRCTKCHDIMGAGRGGNLRRAAIMDSVAPPLGIWLRPLTPAIADRLGLENADGVLVSGVHDSSPARDAGLRIGDVIKRIDDRKVESINEALALLAEKDPKDAVKLQILREGRKRKIFFSIGQRPNTRHTVPGVPAAATTAVPPPGRVAVAATGEDLGAQIAPVFNRAPVFIIHDPVQRRFFHVQNRGLGSLTAGSLASSQLIGSGVQAVIVGNIGPGSFRALKASGVRVYTGAFGSVQNVLAQYRQGKLVEAAGTALPGNRPATGLRNAAAGQKVAVASEGPTVSDRVALNLGLAPYLIIYDLGNGEYEAIAKETSPGPGIDAVQTAHLIVDHGASAVIAGDVPPASVRMLGKLGVFSFAGVSGSVGRAIGMYQGGKLQATTVPAAGGGATRGMTL